MPLTAYVPALKVRFLSNWPDTRGFEFSDEAWLPLELFDCSYFLSWHVLHFP